jgi:DNA repair protein RadA/Sms
MRPRTQFRCLTCGTVSAKWLGKCTECNTWNSFHEEAVASSAAVRKREHVVPTTQHTALSQIDTDSMPRIYTGMAELDRVVGGGFMPGGVVLLGGDPGMGKSTLTLQLLVNVTVTLGATVLYVTGEESLQQIRERANRLNLMTENVLVAAETSLEQILALCAHIKPSMVVVDSVQTMATETLESTAGSVAQVRECAARLSWYAKKTGTPVVIIGHVTKDGMIAGPKVLEHMVDTVLQFEGDGMYSYRVLRAIKNRYGSTNEIGVFDMTSTGLREISNPSEILISEHRSDEPGTALVAVMEGTRPLLMEVQALVSPTGFSMPQRVSTGYDAKRLQMILAVLEKRGGVQIRQSDVFVNIAGGISVQDPALDLGVAVAIASSAYDRVLPGKLAFVGELGLTGEVRRVAYAEQRVAEALRLGIETVYLPNDTSVRSANVVHAERLAHVLSALL